jgi:type IV secretion system protein VirD4
MFRADGNVDGKVLFLLDEAALLGPMKAMKTALTQGRKYGIVMQLYYQDEGQIEDVWGKSGKRSWYNNVSWRAYSGIQDVETAKDLCEILGQFAVEATSQGRNRGRQVRAMEWGSVSSGMNTNQHEISRKLAQTSEILADMRTDERIVLFRNAQPIRCGTAIWFRRPEMAPLIGFNRFSAPAGAASRVVQTLAQ